MHRIKQFFHKKHDERVRKNERASKQVVLEELFNDIYDNRKRIYKVNFIRGVMFGAGSAIGGTIILALIVWVLSLFVNAPFVGQVFKDAQHSIERTTKDAGQKATN